MDGLVDKDTPLKLALPPALAVRLGTATDFNVSAMDMLNKYFASLEIVTAPEYNATATGNTMQLIVKEIMGTPTGVLGFTEKMKASRIVQDLSSSKQKLTDGTVGFVGYRPASIAQMRGM